MRESEMNRTIEDIIQDNYKKYGNMARFIGLSVSSVNQEQQEYDAEFLEWHGQPEVIGVNSDINGVIGNLAGILVDPETAVLIDLANEKILETDDAVGIAFIHSLERTQDPKRDAKIMALYNRLISESLKQQFKAAG